jgi:lipopolysaccharide export system protein LptC
VRHPRLILLLVGLAAASWWLAERGADRPPADAADATARVADYYVRGLEVTTMTPAGRPGRTLQTAELRHFLADNTTELETAQLTVHQREDQPPWVISAERGWLSADGELLLLQGKVTVSRAAAAGIRPLRLETSNLRIQPREDYAETDEHVRVVSRDDEVEAVGMRAWLRAPARLKLHSQVRGRYVPR